MARCESIDVIRGKILEGKGIDVVISDTDSENDTALMLDIADSTEDDVNTSKNSTQHVREFCARQRQERRHKGQHGGSRPGAGRPRSRKTAANRCRVYRQRKKNLERLIRNNRQSYFMEVEEPLNIINPLTVFSTSKDLPSVEDSSNTADLSRPASSESTFNTEKRKINARPVLSVRCLHEDTDEEITSKSDCEDESSSKFIDADDVPELSLKCLDNDEPQAENVENGERNITEQVPDFEPVTTKMSTVICIPIQLHRLGQNIPAKNTSVDPYNFKVKVDCRNLPKKSDSLEFSKSRNKLYVCKDIPFKIIVTAQNVPAESFIRIHAVYSRLEHSRDSVRRCATHAQEDYAKGNPAYEHFVQCTSETAIYEKNTKSGLLSVQVPYEKPQGGQSATPYIIKLTCFSSCSGGINRRPFSLVFTLEKNNAILGKHVMEAKACACPSRDIKNDNLKEKIFCKTEARQDYNGMSYLAVKKESKSSESSKVNESSQPSGQPNYSIKVKDRELFEFLKHMKVLYETGVQISPDMLMDS